MRIRKHRDEFLLNLTPAELDRVLDAWAGETLEASPQAARALPRLVREGPPAAMTYRVVPRGQEEHGSADLG